MITEAEVTAGTARLVASKLKPSDVDKVISAIRMFFGGLEQKYAYDYKTKLTALDDSANTEKQAAQVAAALTKLESEGFGVSGFSGSGSGMYYSEESEYLKYVMFIFSKLYPIPVEFAKYKLSLYSIGLGGRSGTVLTERVP